MSWRKNIDDFYKAIEVSEDVIKKLVKYICDPNDDDGVMAVCCFCAVSRRDGCTGECLDTNVPCGKFKLDSGMYENIKKIRNGKIKVMRNEL